MSKLALHGGNAVNTEPWPHWPQWTAQEQEAILGVLNTGVWGGFDASVKAFEDAFAARLEAKHCIAATNGTMTLEAALRALDVGPGDEVIVPPYT